MKVGAKNTVPEFRNIEKDVVSEKATTYAERLENDPRMRIFSKPSISESEVREKFEAYQMKKEAEAKKAEMLARVQNGETINKPTPEKTEALKKAMNTGAFKFSDKEREVLKEILSK